MNIIKTFRSKSISIFLTCLFLFYSCEKKDFTIKKAVLETTMQNHIVFSDELAEIIKKQKKSVKRVALELNGKDNDVSYFSSNKEYREYLEGNGFTNIDKIIHVSNKIRNNIFDFVNHEKKNNPNITQEEIITKFSDELNYQYTSKNEYSGKSNFCEDQMNKASENCGENYYIQNAAAVVLGFFTFGIGAVVGLALTTAVLVKCHEDASEAYRVCVKYLESLNDN